MQTGEQAQQEEQSSGMTIFFSLLVLGECGDGLATVCVPGLCPNGQPRPCPLPSPSVLFPLEFLPPQWEAPFSVQRQRLASLLGKGKFGTARLWFPLCILQPRVLLD